MGLLYQFPENITDQQHVRVEDNGTLSLSTYGLPPIFWAYLTASLLCVGFLSLAVWPPLTKVLQGKDVINFYLGVSVLALIFGVPFLAICFFFYRKDLVKKDTNLIVTHNLFGLTLLKKTMRLTKDQPFTIHLNFDSPNMAKLTDAQSMRGFQNKGHFHLVAKDQQGKEHIIDRHSRKIDLEKLKSLLQEY
jgi:hypothetical protein